MSSVLDPVDDAVRTCIGLYKPASGAEFDSMCRAVPGTIREFGANIARMPDNWDGEHIHADVKELFRQLGQAVSAAAGAAEDALDGHRRNHRLWLSD